MPGGACNDGIMLVRALCGACVMVSGQYHRSRKIIYTSIYSFIIKCYLLLEVCAAAFKPFENSTDPVISASRKHAESLSFV